MINVVIDTSGSMNSLGKPQVITSIMRELQLTDGISFNYFCWGENVKEISDSDGFSDINFEGKSSIKSLLEFLRKNDGNCLLLTDGFSNEEKSDFTAFIRDNSDIRFRVVLVGADSRIINGKSFFPETFIVTEQEKYVFNSLEVFCAIESFNF